jgi:hypothetical protein
VFVVGAVTTDFAGRRPDGCAQFDKSVGEAGGTISLQKTEAVIFALLSHRGLEGQDPSRVSHSIEPDLLDRSRGKGSEQGIGIEAHRQS